MHIKASSVDSVIIYFSNLISKDVLKEVKAAYKTIKSLEDEAFIEIIPSYNCLLITYDIFKYDYEQIEKLLKKSLENLDYSSDEETNLLSIDVYYGLEVGLDLQRVAHLNKLSIEEVIHTHSSKLYDVYAIGFLPGFAYLASVDKKINTPRLETPRKNIAKGSVAIANNQTAVYPQNSPGGWNILGRTTNKMFDKSLDSLSFIDFNSKVKFNPICKDEFLASGGSLEF